MAGALICCCARWQLRRFLVGRSSGRGDHLEGCSTQVGVQSIDQVRAFELALSIRPVGLVSNRLRTH